MISDFINGSSVVGWMLYSIIIGGVVVLAALAAHDAQRAANRPVRWIWLSAIVGIVSLSAIAPLRQHNSVDVTGIATLQSAPVTASVPEANAGIASWYAIAREAVVAPFQSVLQQTQAIIERVPPVWLQFMTMLWLVTTAVLGLVFAIAYRRIVTRVRRYPHGQVNGVPVRISPQLGPAVVGLAPAEIVVPAWLMSRPVPEQHMVVEHEAEHIRAADPWMLVAAYAAAALMPWNPAMWYAVSRLRLAIELDCDRRVLRRGVPTHSYGALLIDLSAARPVLPVVMPAFPGTYSHLERRLLAMTQRPARFTSIRRIAGAAVAGIALITACESQLPTAAEVASMDVASAERSAAKAGLADTLHSVYLVDGKQVEAQEAKAISAEQIGSVKINRSAGGDSLTVVRIHTKGSAIEPGANQEFMVDGKPKVVMGKLLDSSAVHEVKISGSAQKEFTGLLLVDGVAMNGSSLKSIGAERIESVEVIKGDAAASKYPNDPRAANGVILVTTKK